MEIGTSTGEDQDVVVLTASEYASYVQEVDTDDGDDGEDDQGDDLNAMTYGLSGLSVHQTQPHFPRRGISMQPATQQHSGAIGSPVNIRTLDDDEFMALLRRIRETRTITSRLRRYRVNGVALDEWASSHPPSASTQVGTQTYSTEEGSTILRYASVGQTSVNSTEEVVITDRRSSVEMSSFACRNGCCTMEKRFCGCKLHHRTPHKDALLNRDGEPLHQESTDDLTRACKKLAPSLQRAPVLSRSGR
jgi:hypothetical protein